MEWDLFPWLDWGPSGHQSGKEFKLRTCATLFASRNKVKVVTNHGTGLIKGGLGDWQKGQKSKRLT